MVSDNESYTREAHGLAEILLHDYMDILDQVKTAGKDYPFPDVLSNRLVSLLSEGLEAEKVSISVVDKGVLDKSVLTLLAATGLDEEIVMDTRTLLDNQSSLIAQVMTSGETIHLTNDQAQGMRKGESQRKYSTDSMLAPLTYPDGKPMGVISVTNKVEGDNFSSLDLSVLSFFSQVSSINLANAIFREKDRERDLQAIGRAVQAKDGYTFEHSIRVAKYAILIAEKLRLPGRYLTFLERYAPLHDIGKIGVPGTILNKEDKLTDAQFSKMQKHTIKGYDILPPIEEARQFARYHHERWDGTGYPDRLKGEQIPIHVRVLSVADAFDAMTSDRPYRKGLPINEALERIKKGSGTQFWPVAADAMVALCTNGQGDYVQHTIAGGIGSSK